MTATITYTGKCLICNKPFTVTLPVDEPIRCPHCPKQVMYLDNIYFCETKDQKLEGKL